MKLNRIFPVCTLLLSVTALPLAIYGAEETKPAPAPAAASATAPTPAPAAPAADAKVDFGDFKSSTLTTGAWKALEAKKHDEVAAFTGKCVELYKGKALEMQKSLKEAASSEKANDYWALNDVGTCYYILGKSMEDAGKKKEAVEAYKALADKLSFAQCWDTQGWFWKPAEAAQERIKALDFDSLK